MCYYFDNITKFEDFDFDNNFTDEKSYENILIYKILHRTFIEAKPLRIRFEQIDGFKRVYDGTRYLALFGLEKNDIICNRIRCFRSQKRGITYVFSTITQKL